MFPKSKLWTQAGDAETFLFEKYQTFSIRLENNDENLMCVSVYVFVELYNDINIMMNWKWISSYSVLMLRCGKLFNTINILASDMAWLRSPCPRLQRAELSQLWSYFIQTEFQFVVGWFYRANWRHCTRSTIVNQKEYNKSAKSERLIINNST